MPRRDEKAQLRSSTMGTGTGIWQASNGKLCEARNPTGFLPKGTPSVCNPITSDGSKLTAGALQLIPL